MVWNLTKPEKIKAKLKLIDLKVGDRIENIEGIFLSEQRSVSGILRKFLTDKIIFTITEVGSDYFGCTNSMNYYTFYDSIDPKLIAAGKTLENFRKVE